MNTRDSTPARKTRPRTSAKPDREAAAIQDDAPTGASAATEQAADDPAAEPIEAAPDDLIAALAKHWRKHGTKAFDAALKKDPVRYLALVAKLLPGPAAEAAAIRRDAGGAGEPGTEESLVALLASLDGEEDEKAGKDSGKGGDQPSPAAAKRRAQSIED